MSVRVAQSATHTQGSIIQCQNNDAEHPTMCNLMLLAGQTMPPSVEMDCNILYSAMQLTQLCVRVHTAEHVVPAREAFRKGAGDSS